MALVGLTDRNFEKEVLKSNLPVLVDFYGEPCPPCQMVAPVLEELAKEYEGKVKFAKLNVDENPKTAAKYGVMSIPTVVLFAKRKEVGRIVGFTGKNAYIELISKLKTQMSKLNIKS